MGRPLHGRRNEQRLGRTAGIVCPGPAKGLEALLHGRSGEAGVPIKERCVELRFLFRGLDAVGGRSSLLAWIAASRSQVCAGVGSSGTASSRLGATLRPRGCCGGAESLLRSTQGHACHCWQVLGCCRRRLCCCWRPRMPLGSREWGL